MEVFSLRFAYKISIKNHKFHHMSWPKLACVYGIYSDVYDRTYIGYTTNLNKRIISHYRNKLKTNEEIEKAYLHAGMDQFSIFILHTFKKHCEEKRNCYIAWEKHYMFQYWLAGKQLFNMLDNPVFSKGYFFNTPEARAHSCSKFYLNKDDDIYYQKWVKENSKFNNLGIHEFK